MGGTLIFPTRAKPSGYASFDSHTRRNPKSSEPGTDIFVPIGTEIIAPLGGRIYGSGGTIGPFTGRWVGIDLDNGMRFRTMHHSRNVRTSGRIEQGEVFAISGASGYGYEDWSKLSTMPAAHFHATLWPTWASRYNYDRNGKPYSIDLMKNIGGSSAGGTGDEDMPSEAWLIQLGADIVSQVTGAASPIRADLNSVHQSVLSGTRETVDSVAALRADINYIHTLSPYSLKAILEAERGGTVSLTKEQVAAIGGQLSSAAVAGIDAALRDDFEGVKARLAQLPAETIAALKSAL